MRAAEWLPAPPPKSREAQIPPLSDPFGEYLKEVGML
jgi:hypothetical protein